MRQRSRYYDTKHYQHNGLSLEDNKEARELFNAAVQRFGPAYETACFCMLRRGTHRWTDSLHGYKCGVHDDNWFLNTFDHGTFFQRRGEPISAVVGQPYDYDEKRHGPRLRQYCAEQGFLMEVGRGWHYPGWTAALIFTRAN